MNGNRENKPNLLHTAQELLASVWGYHSFRKGQAEVIGNVLAGYDTLAVMPTGGGKRLTYQLPALAKPGFALVVSPLIALMHDQVAALKQLGVAAECLTTGQDTETQRRIAHDIEAGRIKLLYVAPERLLQERFISYVRQKPVNLLAIDEAHCVSTWGPDFRPEYAQLGALRQLLPNVPILAATATADEHTRADILAKLRMPHAKVFVSSFDRPNLSLSVLPANRRMHQLLQFIARQGPEAPGIVYCLSRKGADEVYEHLNDNGIRAGRYHAGLEHPERTATYEGFLRDELQVVVATIAFGMGIDKSNIRWVAHFNLPGNIEAYYQEIGRAGRDGLPAQTLLLYSVADIKTRHLMYEEASPEHREVLMQKLERLWQLCETPFCRRQVLLQYFGETLETPCGNCDVCRNPRKLVDGTVLAQKILSTVARAAQVGQQVTANTVADVLRGSQAEALKAQGLHTLSTYGIGREWSHRDWEAFANQLVLKGLAGFDYAHRGALTLTDKSRQVLKGQLQVELYPPERDDASTAKTPAPSSLSPLERELSGALRALRSSLAKAQAVPPFVVFSDASLEDMARRKPITLEAFAEVEGAGKAKQEKYGGAFVKEIYSFLNSRGLLSLGTTYGSAPPASPKPHRLDLTPTVLETERLLAEGHTLDSIAELRGISTSAIAEHITRLLEHNHPVDIWKHITPSQLEAVRPHLPLYTAEKRLKPIFDALGGELNYGQIRLALAWLQKQGVNL